MTVDPAVSSVLGADWELRYRAPAILRSSIAQDNPEVGLVTSNATGQSRRRLGLRGHAATPSARMASI